MGSVRVAIVTICWFCCIQIVCFHQISSVVLKLIILLLYFFNRQRWKGWTTWWVIHKNAAIFPYYWAAHEGNAQSRNEKQILSMSKKIKWRTELPESFASPILSSVGPIFARRDVSFQVVWRTDLEVDLDKHIIIVWSYWPYIYALWMII